MSIIDRIQKLLALTKSDNEHEATAAARQACRLILEHDIQLIEGGCVVPILTPEQVRQRYGGTPVGKPLTREPMGPNRADPRTPGTYQSPQDIAKAAREILEKSAARKRHH